MLFLHMIHKGHTSMNKISIQWTPGSQIDRSNQKIIFSKVIFEKNNEKPINYA